MIYAFTAVSAVVPSMLLLWFFHSRDTFREPGRVVWATFGFGVLAIIPVLVVAAPFAIALDAAHLPYPLVVGLVSAFITAGFPEELFKYSVLVLYAGRHQEFDEPMDGIVYGVAASLGFATLENILYTAQGGLGIALMRGLTAVPMHAACGAIMGWFYGRARFSPPGQRLKPYLLGYLVPVVFHGLYDAPLLTLQEIVEGLGGADPSGDQATLMFGLMAASCVVLLVQLVAAVVLVQRARKEQQTAAVAAGQAVLQPARERSPVLGWLGVLTGGGLASVGGLFLLGALAVLVLQPPMDPGTDPMAAVGGFVILGAPPLLVGLLAFGLGVRSLNRRGAPEVVLVGAPPR